jgi:hypothetical protein
LLNQKLIIMTNESVKLQREVPIIEADIKALKRLEPKIKELECQVEAIVKYNNACAKAMEKLTETLNKCVLKK